jgi:hypothetical protein
MAKKKTTSQQYEPVYTIGNPEDVPPGRALSQLGPGYVDFVCVQGTWHVLYSSCSQGYVPPASGPGEPCYIDGRVVRCACVQGTDSAYAQAQIRSAQSSGPESTSQG